MAELGKLATDLTALFSVAREVTYSMCTCKPGRGRTASEVHQRVLYGFLFVVCAKVKVSSLLNQARSCKVSKRLKTSVRERRETRKA